GSSHPQLAEQIALMVGVQLGRVKLSKFSNKETNVEIQENYTYDTPAILGSIPTSPSSSEVKDPLSVAFNKFSVQDLPSKNSDNNDDDSDSGYKHWIARSGTLIANLLTCAGYYVSVMKMY
ncbi:13788_t:CDS:2, partial [Entrophospora sp. SA101]